MKIEDAFRAAGIGVADSDFAVCCGSCALWQLLSDCAVRKDGERTEYVCSRLSCPSVVLIVAPSSALVGGFQLGTNAYAPMGELVLGGLENASGR